MDKPPFDPQRAAFLLVAFVIGVQAVVALSFAAACVWYSDRIIGADANCDPSNRLTALLMGALAAALAFAGIRK